MYMINICSIFVFFKIRVFRFGKIFLLVVCLLYKCEGMSLLFNIDIKVSCGDICLDLYIGQVEIGRFLGVIKLICVLVQRDVYIQIIRQKIKENIYKVLYMGIYMYFDIFVYIGLYSIDKY